jgi:hypothetical protein
MVSRCAALDRPGRMMFDGVTMRRTVFVTDAGIVDLYACYGGRGSPPSSPRC